VYADLAEVAGNEGLLSLARSYLGKGEPVKALHIVEVALAGEPDNREALLLRQEALSLLMERAEAGIKNDYEIYWLKYRLADTQSRLDNAGNL
jgi:Tfp pilus assembly protein PilF